MPDQNKTQTSLNELRDNLPGVWLGDPNLPTTLTYKKFGNSMKMYLAMDIDMTEPLTLHALGWLSPNGFNLTADNGFRKAKQCQTYYPSDMVAIVKGSAWCWMEPPPPTSPIKDDFTTVILNLKKIEELGHNHTSKVNKIKLINSKPFFSSSGAVVLKHAMIIVHPLTHYYPTRSTPLLYPHHSLITLL